MTVYTIGHSTRPLEEFIALLQAHGVAQLADVRTDPEVAAASALRAGRVARIAARGGHRLPALSGLGGLRKPAADSRNSGWRHAGFRGYADYMQTPAFTAALDELIAWAAAAPTAVMCAEAVWWRCHRQLIADALVARGIDVRHIISAKAAPAHALTSFARVDGGQVTYPGLV